MNNKTTERMVFTMGDNTTISIQMLFLNDLLNSKAIDEDLYNKASQKINKLINTINPADVSTLPTPA